WDLGGDLEQLLIRGGLTWRPESSTVKFTLGYAWIKSGAFGPSSASSYERRLYQEALIPQMLGTKIFLTHRIRLEQRDVDGQNHGDLLDDFCGVSFTVNQRTLRQRAVYLSF